MPRGGGRPGGGGLPGVALTLGMEAFGDPDWKSPATRASEVGEPVGPSFFRSLFGAGPTPSVEMLEAAESNRTWKKIMEKGLSGGPTQIGPRDPTWRERLGDWWDSWQQGGMIPRLQQGGPPPHLAARRTHQKMSCARSPALPQPRRSSPLRFVRRL